MQPKLEQASGCRPSCTLKYARGGRCKTRLGKPCLRLMREKTSGVAADGLVEPPAQLPPSSGWVPQAGYGVIALKKLRTGWYG